ncbi:acyl-CoA dehydrogenase [Geothermobacter ehrlichii]|uniref:Acyl-[acyl-carrier-protein] dehydrogenase MbtN n=1 Tax=Geothermobacter ehrlichii TaxID=213224 RepID=A0A5D3WHS9_9BACT|nr:acyl-CoA dehydrogenase family protein [Geothermobacter ehrlichii]TYO98425.1 acyl-CoA dehydrogenase [Geothermobacter ehrlichii]
MKSNEPTWMDDELRILRDSVRQFYLEEFVPHYERWCEQGVVDREAWIKAGEMGILLPSIPEEYGGAGGTFAHDVVIQEELYRLGITGFNVNVHGCILAHYILSYGTDEQKNKWLPKMATGEMIGAIAMTEPGAGSDLGNITTSARREGDHYIINGSKTFITNGVTADLVCVVVKTAPELKHKGISLVMVETDGLEGFTRGKPLKKIGQKASDTTELFFDNVRVPVSNLLGTEEGKGFAQLMGQLPRERMYIALRAIAFIERAIDLTVQYVKDRKAFGKPLIEFQNTRFKLAECKTEAKIARVFFDHCVEEVLAGNLDSTTAAMAKWWFTQKQCEIVDECFQFFGGYGYMLEYPIAHLYADSRVQKIYGGANEIMKELIARSL